MEILGVEKYNIRKDISLERLDSRFKMTWKGIGELKIVNINYPIWKNREKKGFLKNKQRLKNIWDNHKHIEKHVITSAKEYRQIKG